MPQSAFGNAQGRPGSRSCLGHLGDGRVRPASGTAWHGFEGAFWPKIQRLPHQHTTARPSLPNCLRNCASRGLGSGSQHSQPCRMARSDTCCPARMGRDALRDKPCAQTLREAYCPKMARRGVSSWEIMPWRLPGGRHRRRDRHAQGRASIEDPTPAREHYAESKTKGKCAGLDIRRRRCIDDPCRRPAHTSYGPICNPDVAVPPTPPKPFWHLPPLPCP